MQGCPRKIKEQAYMYIMSVPSWNMPCPTGSTNPRTSLEDRDGPAPSSPLCLMSGWQKSSYCILSCTVLLHSHQHHYAYIPNLTYTHSVSSITQQENIFQHSFPYASWTGGIVLPAYTRAAPTLELEGTSCCAQNRLNAWTTFTCNMYILKEQFPGGTYFPSHALHSST